jgi:hypothetical protein
MILLESFVVIRVDPRDLRLKMRFYDFFECAGARRSYWAAVALFVRRCFLRLMILPSMILLQVVL